MSAHRLTAGELRRLNAVIFQLGEPTFRQPAYEPLLDLLEQLLPGASISIDEAPHGAPELLHRAGRHLEPIPNLNEKIALFCRENPVVIHVLQGHYEPVLRISDFLTFRQFRESACYREIHSHLTGWRDQAAMAFLLRRSTVGIGLNQARPFADHERFLLELLHPHVARVLARWAESSPPGSSTHLTAREREVLQWMAEGKRDAEIAVILAISVRTVEQHVRACLRKLEAENRSVAVMKFWREA